MHNSALGDQQAVIDGDGTGNEPTTVIDFSEGYPQVVRSGAGDTSSFL